MDDLKSIAELTKKELATQYFADNRPWVIAFSGGKDSTLVLQLVYEFLLEHANKQLKPVFVVTSDTMVEPPNIATYPHDVLQAFWSGGPPILG